MIYYQRLENSTGTIVIDRFTDETIMSKLSYFDEETEFIWDNEDYLLNTIYPLLKRYNSNTLTDDDTELINELEISVDYLIDNEAIELIEEAIKRKWL